MPPHMPTLLRDVGMAPELDMAPFAPRLRVGLVWSTILAMILAQLLGSMPVATFLEQYYLKLPLAMAGGCEPWLAAGSRATIEQLLRSDGVDALVGREGQTWDGPLPPPPEQLDELLAAGYTLGIRHAHLHDEALAQLAAEFASAFAAPIDVHLYYTPADQPGFGWHYDAEDVFILQTHGSKQWSLRKNTVNPWPLMETTPHDMRYGREIMPLMRCTLSAGHWLYIPAGYWHRTDSGEASISLSIGVLSATGVDVLDAARAKLLDSLRWRQRLPTPGTAATVDDEALVAEYQSLLADLGTDIAALLASEPFVRDFLAARRAQAAQQQGAPPHAAR